MIHGSMKHYPSGRKKKYNAWKKTTRKVEFKPMEPIQTYRRETTNYPSHDGGGSGSTGTRLDTKERQEISSQYTVAPAYNKGAYQVIPRDQVENIGK